MKIIQTMPCRVSGYEAIVNGYEKTKVHLISFNDKCNGGSDILSLGGHTDYVGSYYFIPNLARAFNLEINLSTNIFFVFYGLLCIFISLITFNSIDGSKKYKLIGSSAIFFLGTLFIVISDTYSFYGLTSLALIPFWDNYLIKKKSISTISIIFFSLFSGIIIGISDSVRGFSGSFIAIAIIVMMLTSNFKSNFKIRTFSIILILIPILVINNFFNHLLNKRDLYFEENPKLKKLVNERGKYLNNSRAVWHNAFYNLSYLKDNNVLLPDKSDVGSVKWARKIDPKIKLYTKDYEILLKNEYFKFVKNNPIYFIKIKLAKIFVILTYFLVFCNYGIYILIKEKNNKKIISFYSLGLILFSTIGIATEPLYSYMLGFITFSSLFTISLIYKKFNDQKFN